MESNYNCHTYNLMSPSNLIKRHLTLRSENDRVTQRFCDIKSTSLTLFQRRVPNWN